MITRVRYVAALLVASAACAAALTSCALQEQAVPNAQATATETPSAASSSVPNLAIAKDIADIEEETSTTIALSMYSPKQQVNFGSLGTLPVWSTIKVPIALAALEYCDISEAYREELILASLKWSDNKAAWDLWVCMGSPTQSQEIVEDMLAEEGVNIHIDDAYGLTLWSVPSQARYGYYLSSIPQDNPVIVGMSNVIEEQRWGLGTIDEAVFKGGWSEVADGSFHSRQMGYITLDGEKYGVALAARSAEGSQLATQEALTAVASLLAVAGTLRLPAHGVNLHHYAPAT